MSFPFYIAKRYLLSKSDNNAINYITIIAAIGVIVGSAALFIVLSGFAGLKEFSLQFSSIVDPDLKATASIGKTFTLSKNDTEKLNDVDGIAYFSKVIEERVIIEYDQKNILANIKGVDSDFPKVNTTDSIVKLGSWMAKDVDQIVAGWAIAQDLSFGVLDYGKTVQLYVPKPGKGQISSIKGAFNSIKVINVGIFDINEELNKKYVYANLETAQALLNYNNNQISAIEFKLLDDANQEMVTEAIHNILGDSVIIKNREQQNDALYKMLNTEYLAVYLIFTLVLIIALFNVIGSIAMMILDKKKNIKTLYNLGATNQSIRKIFFYQGSLMTIVGGLIGLTLGWIIIWVQKTFALVMITSIHPYPVSIKLINIVIVAVTISVLGILASKIASSRVSKSLIQDS